MRIGFHSKECIDNSRLNYLCQNFMNMQCQASIYKEGAGSLFDYLDIFKPEYFVIYPSLLKRDLIEYCKRDKELKLILDISELSQLKHEDAKKPYSDLCELPKKQNLPISFIVSNYDNKAYRDNKDLRFVYMPDCYDENIKINNEELYEIDFGVIINKKADRKIYEPSCHFICNSVAAQSYSDINFTYINKVMLLKNYNTIIFRSFPHGILPQIFFDSIMHSKSVYYDIEDESERELVNKSINIAFGKDFVLDYNAANKLTDFSEMKDIIIRKHSSKNRTKTFISQMKENYELLELFKQAYGEPK